MIVSLGSHEMPGTHMHDVRWTKCGSCLRVLMQVPTHQFPQIHWLFGDAKYDNGENPDYMELMGSTHEINVSWSFSWDERNVVRSIHGQFWILNSWVSPKFTGCLEMPSMTMGKILNWRLREIYPWDWWELVILMRWTKCDEMKSHSPGSLMRCLVSCQWDDMRWTKWWLVSSFLTHEFEHCFVFHRSGLGKIRDKNTAESRSAPYL